MVAMRYLAVWLMLICVPLFAALSGVMTVIGSRYSSEATQWAALGFTHCALPCWAGMTPGETPFDTTQIAYQVVQTFRDPSTNLVLSGSQINFWTRAADPQQPLTGLIFYTDREYAGGVIGDIRLSFSLPIWQLIANLGEPDCVWTEATMGPQSRRVLAVYWEDGDGVSIGTLLAVDARGSWHPATHIDSFWISVTSSACDQPEATPWMGFASFFRYIAHKQ